MPFLSFCFECFFLQLNPEGLLGGDQAFAFDEAEVGTGNQVGEPFGKGECGLGFLDPKTVTLEAGDTAGAEGEDFNPDRRKGATDEDGPCRVDDSTGL